MARLSQTDLIQKTKTLTTNGLLPEAQAIISEVGYTPAALAIGAGYAEAVLNGPIEVKVAKAGQTSATRAEEAYRAAAQREATAFAETARIIFADDPDTLIALDLQTHYETVTDPETGETKKVATRFSKATADVIAHWNTMFTNGGTRPEPQKTLLANAGWDADRLTAALDAVEAYSNADIAQQVAIGHYQARSEQQKTDVESLRQWYSIASNLCRIAIKRVDPANSQQLLEILGLA